MSTDRVQAAGMIMMIACAVLGAALGLYARPRWLGVAVAVTLVVLIEGGQMVVIGLLHGQPNRELLIQHLQDFFGEGPLDAAGPVAASLIGGGLAALMGRFSDSARPTHVLTADGIRRKVGKNGRYARMEGMVEERPAQNAAESRFDKILGL